MWGVEGCNGVSLREGAETVPGRGSRGMLPLISADRWAVVTPAAETACGSASAFCHSLIFSLFAEKLVGLDNFVLYSLKVNAGNDIKRRLFCEEFSRYKIYLLLLPLPFNSLSQQK